jgi:hypothetical protein
MVYPNDDVWVSGDLIDDISAGFSRAGATIEKVAKIVTSAKGITLANRKISVVSDTGAAQLSKRGVDVIDVAPVSTQQAGVLSQLIANPYVLAIGAFLAYKLIKGR